MDYDFSGLCADHLEKLNKRLSSLNKSFVKEYKLGLNIINHPKQNECRNEILTEIEDALREVIAKAEIFYTEALNKVQRSLGKHL